MTESQASSPSPLDYASPSTLQSRPEWFHMAVACGAIPMITGLGIFLVWILTDWRWLMPAGMFTIFGGLIFFVIGEIFLIAYLRREKRIGLQPYHRLKMRKMLAGGLLMANFPVAAGLLVAAIYIETRYTVTVINAGQIAIDSFVLSGDTIQLELGPIPAGKKVKRSPNITADDSLTYTMKQGGQASSGMVDGYVTPNHGGGKIITVNDRSVTVTDTRN